MSTFGQPIPSFPPREVLYDYITGRAKANNVRRFIQFNTAVRWISYDEKTGKFAVTVQDQGRRPDQDRGSSTRSSSRLALLHAEHAVIRGVRPVPRPHHALP